MKVSKITASVCILLDFFIGIFIYNIPETYILALNIFLGVFTGLFVSIVTSLTGYFHEKATIISKVKSQLLDVYFDLLTVKQMTGDLLPKIIYTDRLDTLNYRHIISIAEITIKAIDKNSLKMYSPFLKNGKWANLIKDIDSFECKLYGLKNNLNNIQKNVLDADLLQLEKEGATRSFVIFPKESLLIEKRNHVNILTARVDEYEASLLLELDDLSREIFGSDWEKKRSELITQVTNLLRNYGD